MHYLKQFLKKHVDTENHLATISYLAQLDFLMQTHPEVAKSIISEIKKQRSFLKLIASENYSSLAVQLAMGNLMTDKYAEGHPHHRFYAGCENVDAIESHGVAIAKKVFNAEHAYIQPHSGADANLIAFWGILIKRIELPFVEKLQKKSVQMLSPEEYETIRREMNAQKILGLSLDAGGHLTHGSRVNVSSKMFQAISYGVDPKTGLIDYKTVETIAKKEKPLILLAGYSAYPRHIDFAKMREIADSVGATFVVDMAHFAGLVAGKAFTGNHNPIPFAEVVTSTTHKTLRGPRGGLVLCQNEYKEFIDKGCPHVIGGPLPNVMAAKAIAFEEALEPSFESYAKQVVLNANALAERLKSKGVHLVTGGTDNHLVLVDVQKSFGLTGRQAETALTDCHITLNRNSIPNDQNGPWYTSGIRFGSAALTTRGMKEREMEIIADLLYDQLKATKPAIDPQTGQASLAKIENNPSSRDRIKEEVRELLKSFPLYPEICLDEST